MKRIIVTIGKDAEVKVETQGFEGASCLAETEALEAALGGATDIEKTREFYHAHGAGQGETAKAGN